MGSQRGPLDAAGDSALPAGPEVGRVLDRVEAGCSGGAAHYVVLCSVDSAVSDPL